MIQQINHSPCGSCTKKNKGSVCVVVSQSMYFPWVGLLEQARLADVFVHYDDVQMTRGFFNRVQVKGKDGTRWMTVPVRDFHRGKAIDEVEIDHRLDWRKKHRNLLDESYRKAPFYGEMKTLVDEVFDHELLTVADASRVSMHALFSYFGIARECTFLNAREMGICGHSSRRLFDIVKSLCGNIYLTGHGAANYLDHQLFDAAGIDVRYMHYECREYPQINGPFTPYVSALDLVANCGRAGVEVISSGTVGWREFLAYRARHRHES